MDGSVQSCARVVAKKLPGTLGSSEVLCDDFLLELSRVVRVMADTIDMVWLIRGRFILRRCHTLLPAISHKDERRRRKSPIARNYSTVTRARRTEPEQEAFTSPNEASGNERETASTSSHYVTSLRTVGLCVFSAVAFGVGLGFKDGIGKASEFFAGYLLEQSLSVDNLFVFVLIFKYFKVPLNYQLFAEEGEDTDLSDNFIVKTCQKFIPVTSSYDGNRFITMQDGVWKVDSIPAVFGVTQDPFIVISSNLFAILGLRSYYTLVSESMADLEYLQPAIGVVLGFIGCKMILDFFGLHISTEVSLGFVATSLLSGVLLSLVNKKDRQKEE
ncbi:uncharacterized membrane protein stkorf319 [Phtheirospermum japonicum]|uniref:Uncharacterized membrane protein stkorf319 n=1 Tax=Phtheirospermum japonicum TaxID=374723 RepID=A0A830BEM9_9LAMI|nr:uncharacterized membrane protein stkorf319 [Phtheirospermum japonicum]